MIINIRYAYFFLTIPFLILWIVLFILGRKTRKKQLEISILNLPIVIIETLYLNDYWNPPSIFPFRIGPLRFLIEDFLFSFAIFGISAIIYEAVLSKSFIKIENPNSKKIIIQPFMVGLIITTLLLFFGVNSVLATSLGFIIISTLIIYKRRDLLFKSLFTGIIVTIFAFFVYYTGFFLTKNSEEILQQIWLLYKTPLGIRFMDVPTIEMFWMFSYSMVIAVAYAFVRNLRTA